MASYISPAEAAIYADSFSSMATPKALALLSAASSTVNAYCNRTFTIDELDDSVKCAIAMVGEWLDGLSPSKGLVTSEKIGDYQVSYAAYLTTDIPAPVKTLLASYRIIAVA